MIIDHTANVDGQIALGSLSKFNDSEIRYATDSDGLSSSSELEEESKGETQEGFAIEENH